MALDRFEREGQDQSYKKVKAQPDGIRGYSHCSPVFTSREQDQEISRIKVLKEIITKMKGETGITSID